MEFFKKKDFKFLQGGCRCAQRLMVFDRIDRIKIKIGRRGKAEGKSDKCF